MAHPARPDTALAEHIVAFGRVLRRAGLDIGSGQMMDAIRAVEAVGVRRRDDVYQALFSVFVRRPGQVELFDQAFHLFWRAPSELADLLQMMLPSAGAAREPAARRRVQEALAEPEDRPPPPDPIERGEDEERDEVEVVASYSAAEVLRKKDFAEFTAEEIAAAKEAIRRMQWPVEPQRVRRRTPRQPGRYLDLRRTIRQSLRRHGEFVDLRFQGPKRKPRPIVILCDVSGSMEPYARMLLHFMHAVSEGMERVESFVFGTRLTRITRHLRRRDIDAAIDDVAEQVTDWAGGTRIGEALRVFNYTWLRRVLRSGGVVLIISDGCDRGDVDRLEQEMARLARSCYRVLWLNPLLRYEGYEPLTRGMRAALPYVDDFLPVHNLESLEQLGAVLTQVARRPGQTWRQRYGWSLDG
ncbi:MAG: VWA domain-containing protein [Bacteroidetes bacterium]|nr:MAG: VWA domain-containing protein [Bacteroidota bacterium]